jgi:predicted small secreted protein
MKKAVFTLLLIAVCVILYGCGETVSGVGKDVNRMGRGISTFFFRQP